MAEHPAALQLRLLQTVVEVAAEKNSTLVLPFPVELLRFLERTTPPTPGPAPPAPPLPPPAPPLAPPGEPSNGHEPLADDTAPATTHPRPALTAGATRARPGREPGQVHRLAGAGLTQLGAAGEAVGQHRDVRVRGPDRRQQHPLGARHRHRVVAPLEAEVAGEAAAAGVERLGVDPERGHRGVVGLGAELGVLVAVHLHQRALPGGDAAAPARRRGRRAPRRRSDALREAGGERLVGQQLRAVGAQGGGARRLQPDDRDAGARATARSRAGCAAARGGRRRPGRWWSRSARSRRCAAAARRRSRGPRAPRRRRRRPRGRSGW